MKTDYPMWTKTISSKTSIFDLRLKELWQYKDLVIMFIRRDFITMYKQTILGPIWFIIQPLLTTVTYAVIFGRIAQISTEGQPMFLFYMAGITIWNYFNETLNRAATIFRDYAHLLSKVYFPRLTLPLSTALSNLMRFSVQFSLFLLVWIYFLFTTDVIKPSLYILITPLLILIMGLLSLGFGMIISALTNKYKDLMMLLAFGIQLLMFATPVIYPVSSLPEKYKGFILANPLSHVVESFRFAYLGSGSFSWLNLGYSLLFGIAVLIIGIVVFNKVEKSFTDVN